MARLNSFLVSLAEEALYHLEVGKEYLLQKAPFLAYKHFFSSVRLFFLIASRDAQHAALFFSDICEVRYQLAAACELLGNTDEARKYYLSIAPFYPKARERLLALSSTP